MDAQTLEPSVKEGSIDMGRLRDIVLVRIATTAGEFARAELIRDLGPLVLHRVSAVDWRHALDRTLAALADAGLVALKTLTVAATDAGRKRAGMVIGGRGQLPKTWREARDVRLVAKALGLEGETPARLKLLLRPDGLRMAIVQSAFAIKLRGVATASRLRSALAGIALDRAFLQEPLPTDEFAFKRRVEEGRGRLTLIANEVARLTGIILVDYAAAVRKIKDTKVQPDATADAAQQLQRLVGKRFLADTPWSQLHHFARYLKAIALRLDKLRADPARDTAKLAELRPQEQRYWRLFAERKGVTDERMSEFRWLLEELRVSFFAQELRTPQPVSVKRLDKAWTQLHQ